MQLVQKLSDECEGNDERYNKQERRKARKATRMLLLEGERPIAYHAVLPSLTPSTSALHLVLSLLLLFLLMHC